jgi:hypothetical protein
VSSKISPIRRSGVSFVRTGENHIYERASQSSDEEPGTGRRDSILPQSIEHVLSDVKFISDHLKEEDDYSSVYNYLNIFTSENICVSKLKIFLI